MIKKQHNKFKFDILKTFPWNMGYGSTYILFWLNDKSFDVHTYIYRVWKITFYMISR